MKKKGLLCFVIILILSIQLPIVNADFIEFDDVEDSWYSGYVQTAYKWRLFNGTGERTFSPDNNITRSDFVTVLGRLYERVESVALDNTGDFFIDVNEDAYYSNYVNWAAKNEIVSGYGDGIFAPSEYITREQMAQILYNFIIVTDLEPKDERGSHFAYNDFMSISEWSRDAVDYVSDYSIMNGNSGYFMPNDLATRAEAATVYVRFCYLVSDWGEFA